MRNQKSLIEKRVQRFKQILLIIRLGIVGVILSSLYHLKYMFSTAENSESGLVPWILAITIDLVFPAIAYGISEYKKSKEKPTLLYIALAFFFVITLYGNTYYAISKYLGIFHLELSNISMLDPLVVLTFIISSSSIPIIALTLVSLNSLLSLKLEKEEERLAYYEDKEESMKQKEEAKAKASTKEKSTVKDLPKEEKPTSEKIEEPQNIEEAKEEEEDKKKVV